MNKYNKKNSVKARRTNVIKRLTNTITLGHKLVKVNGKETTEPTPLTEKDITRITNEISILEQRV